MILREAIEKRQRAEIEAIRSDAMEDVYTALERDINETFGGMGG